MGGGAVQRARNVFSRTAVVSSTALHPFNADHSMFKLGFCQRLLSLVYMQTCIEHDLLV